MRFPASIIAFILGLLLAGIGVGLLTVWASDEVPTAATQEVQDAPLTVIGEDLIDPEQEREEFTISAEGEYTIALARTQDIEAWVGDAAHVTIGAVQEGTEDAPATIETQYTEGEATVPDPSGSDLWAASETTEGDLRYRWSAPDDSGEWSLLIFRDGEEPAPAAVTVELPEEEDSLLGTVLIVLGALSILLGIFLLYRALAARRRDREAEPAAVGTRDHDASGDATASGTAATAGTSTTGASAAAAAGATATAGATGAAAPAATTGTATTGTATTGTATTWAAGDPEESSATDPISTEDEMNQNHGEDEAVREAGSQDLDPAENELTGVMGSISTTESTHDPEALKDRETDQDIAEDPEETGRIDPVPGNHPEDPAAADAQDDPEDETRQGRTWRSRSVATAAGVVLALSPSVLLADAQDPSQDPAEDESAQTEDVEAEEVEAEDGEDAGYSVLLESQLQGIIDEIAETTAAADAEFDADLLSPRVSGNAAQVRELTYRNHEIDDEVLPDAIGTQILSAAVTSGTDFPRQAVVITQEAEAEIPQVLVIEQASPRENYELTQSVLMVPGTEFPAISAEDGGVEPVDPDAEEARFAANHAMERVAVFLNNREYYFGMSVEENAYIEDLQGYQDELREGAEDLSISYTRPLITEGSTAMRLPDGSVIAIGSFDSTTRLRPDDGASINLSGVTAELAGTESTTEDVDIVNRESMILHIPAEDGERVVVLGVHDIVNEVNILD
ncbi:hypothetical protein [Nesterenkonia jeotgali]|uniref:Uncharacterized protein n=1 Tax=Nesterenkonia jeotgali TaxID=317018 RepID=A0A0W8ICN8_9MICC|nr:hypothetical protein [Nesterenkonia jeotgali]KUG57725.1 hypothetical protein AVL63_04140 [Nesterenkonia jeotgali]